MREVFEVCEFCVFDLETTGLDPGAGAEPLEAGAVRIEGGSITETYESFARPRGNIPAEVQGLTGIAPEDVHEAPSGPAVLGELMEFAGDAVLVAHNIDFDRSFLDAYAPSPVTNDGIDTLRMARTLLGGTNHSLDHLVNRFNLTRSDAHRALEDARATADLFLELADRIGTYEDYRQCGIPRSVVREDLGVLLAATEVGRRDRTVLVDAFRTTSELLETGREEVERRTGLNPDDVRNVLPEAEEIYENDYRKLGPPVRLTNAYSPRFWGPVNYVLNGLGLVVLLWGLFASNPEAFYARMLASVPFFVMSPIMTYLRERSHGPLLRLTAALLVVGLWVSVLAFAGWLDLIRREFVSLLQSGGFP